MTSYYLAKNAVFLLCDHLPRALVGAGLYYVVAAPFVPFAALLGVTLLVCFASSGLGVMLSTLLAPSARQLIVQRTLDILLFTAMAWIFILL